MNSIEESIVELIQGSQRRIENRDRNTKLVLDYYGFGDATFLTQEDAAKLNELNNRERARQIIREQFCNNSKALEINGVVAARELIKRKSILFWSDIKYALQRFDFIDPSYHPADLLRLLNDLGYCQDYELLAPNGEKVVPSNVEVYQQFLFVNKTLLKNVQSAINKIRCMPASAGLVRLSDVALEGMDQRQLKTLVANIPGSWTWEFQSDTWFLFEDRGNRLLNLLEKAFCTGDVCELNRLGECLENALKRWQKTDLPFPPFEVIREYIITSRFTEVKNEIVSYHGELGTLNPIDQDLFEYLSTVGSADSLTLREHLGSKGHGKPLIIKTVHNSPLVYVDKSLGRKKYCFSLVCHKKKSVSASELQTHDRYVEYANKLKNIARLGTDVEVKTTRRREQELLRDWLFDEKDIEHCAICGREFDVLALVAAHKKKRSQCSESERIDPYIVMPVCVFGCDYLYENFYVRVGNGEVIVGSEEPRSATVAESISKIVGKQLAERWMLGSKAYFEMTID